MSLEVGSDRQKAGFLMIAAFGFPHGNETFARHLFNSSTSMFSISFVNSCCCWNHVEQNISQKLLKVADTNKKCKQTYQFSVQSTPFVADTVGTLS